jgi:ATP-dependent transcriptional regulator
MTFLVRLVSALAAQNPPVTLIVDDLHVLTRPTVLTELDFVLRNAHPGLRWWSLPEGFRCCPCTATGWPVS